MSYQEQADLYRDEQLRARAEMCIREQGAIFGNDGRPDIAALGRAATAGDHPAIDALIAAVCTSPNWAVLGQDGDLLAAVQGVWPTVAGAIFGTAS
jgi:hypothetical protein